MKKIKKVGKPKKAVKASTEPSAPTSAPTEDLKPTPIHSVHSACACGKSVHPDHAPQCWDCYHRK